MNLPIDDCDLARSASYAIIYSEASRLASRFGLFWAFYRDSCESMRSVTCVPNLKLCIFCVFVNPAWTPLIPSSYSSD